MQSIREFLDEAENGVVIISLGTRVNWKSIRRDKLEAITQALSKLKQRVLWKLDIELPFQAPNNVMIMKWIPQNEILCRFHNLKIRKTCDSIFVFIAFFCN